MAVQFRLAAFGHTLRAMETGENASSSGTSPKAAELKRGNLTPGFD